VKDRRGKMGVSIGKGEVRKSRKSRGSTMGGKKREGKRNKKGKLKILSSKEEST